jgi:hypothetical protein
VSIVGLICSICGLSGDESLFKKRSDGHRPHNCIPCYRKRMVEAQKKYAAKFKEKVLERVKKYYRANKDEIRKKDRIRREKNKEKYREIKRLSYLKNREHNCEYSRLWAKRNRESNLKKKKEWRVKNPFKSKEYAALRGARVRAAIPAWADKEKIKQIYREAKRTCLTVDHIVPLKSNIVCGLHVPDNLRLMTKVENMKKFNRYWPDMPEAI